MSFSSSTATTLFPAPPPTSNALPKHHRARLLHSTRKLADVLGATPLVLDEPKTDRRTRRHGSVFEFASAFDPANVKARPCALDLRPTLMRIEPVCVSPSDPRAHLAPALTPSPCASVFPTTPDADAACVRRRRMAKLARTLGENVPAELVFPVRARRRSASVGAIVFAPSSMNAPDAIITPPPTSAPAPAPISSPRPLKPAPRQRPRPLPSLPARPTARTAVRPLPLPTQRAPLPDLWRKLPASSRVQTASSRVQSARPLPVGVKPKSADSASYHTAKAPSSYYTAPRSAVPSSYHTVPSSRSVVPSSYHTAASSLSSLPSSLSLSSSSPSSSRSSSRSATPTSESESESMYAPSETPPSSAPTSRVGTPVSRAASPAVSRAASPAVSRAASPAVSAVCPRAPSPPTPSSARATSPQSSRAASPPMRACSPAVSAVCPRASPSPATPSSSRAASPATPSSSRAPTPAPDAPFSQTLTPLSPHAARAELLAAATNRKQSWVGAWRMESEQGEEGQGEEDGDGVSMREVQRRLRALR